MAKKIIYFVKMFSMANIPKLCWIHPTKKPQDYFASVLPLKIQRHPNLNGINNLPWNPHTEATYKAHLIRGLRSQEVSCKGLQLMVGHIF